MNQSELTEGFIRFYGGSKMSIFSHFSFVEDLKQMLELNHKNTYWSMNRLVYKHGFSIRMGFKVNGEYWIHESIVNERRVIDQGINYIYPTIEKLLAQKETTRICVKFWTGVEII